MKAILLGIGISLIFGAILVLTHQGAASNLAFEMANKAVRSARVNGMWNNVTLRRNDQDSEFGLWYFKAEVRDFGTVQTYWLEGVLAGRSAPIGKV